MAFEVRFWVMLGICLSAVGGRSYSMDSMDSNTFGKLQVIILLLIFINRLKERL